VTGGAGESCCPWALGKNGAQGAGGGFQLIERRGALRQMPGGLVVASSECGVSGAGVRASKKNSDVGASWVGASLVSVF